MIVTIDGPAGAGKSTVAKRLADRLGFLFLDTGAMYRAVTLAALQQSADLTNQNETARIASEIEIEFDGTRVMLAGVDVSSEIRSQSVTRAVSEIADNPVVREQLVMLQRQIAAGGDYVCEGRDQGTVAFPNAECKIFLTASSSERARRRFQELSVKDSNADFDRILADQEARDLRDSKRPVGRLTKADDAVEISTDGLTIEQVVDCLAEIVEAKIQASNRNFSGQE